MTDLFGRFTDRARRVVVLAQEEARMFNHNYIGTEHILLGLIHEGEGIAYKALESLGVSLEFVRDEIEKFIGLGQQVPSGHIPFTPRAKKVLELSAPEALRLGQNYIGTEHILLGLVREGEQDGGVAAVILATLNVELTLVRQKVVELLGRLQDDQNAVAEEQNRREAQAILQRLIDNNEPHHAESVALEMSRQVATMLAKAEAEVARFRTLQSLLAQWLADQ